MLLIVLLFHWEFYWIATHIRHLYVLVPVLALVAFVGISCRNKGLDSLLVLVGTTFEGVISNLLKGNYVELVNGCKQFGEDAVNWWKQQ